MNNPDHEPATKEDLRQAECRIIERCRSVERGGLYILVFLCVMYGCDASTRTATIRDTVERIENMVTVLVEGVR